RAWGEIGHSQLVVESFIRFRRELSIIAVRGIDGETACYPMAENMHENGILRFSVAPAPQLDPATQTRAEEMVQLLLKELDYVGTLALELFETDDGLLANEMAPRVHNSGHWTQDGAVTSQFENHVRAIAGLPLGNTQHRSPTCMINIIGETGDIPGLLKLPYTHLHLYDKQPRPGRKLGHVNICADSYEELGWRAMNAASLLPGTPEFRYSVT
ncbi:MAG: ATP-grasp domain-containing protein, partial [Halomonadaceae bacterium]